MKSFRLRLACLGLVLFMVALCAIYADDVGRRIAFCRTNFTSTEVLSEQDAALRAFVGMNACTGNYPTSDLSFYVPSFMYIGAWPLAQQIEASISISQIPGAPANAHDELRKRLNALRYYWDDNPETPGYDAAVRSKWWHDSMYYDDNAWIGIALLELYRDNPDESWGLEKARRIFDLEKKGAFEAQSMREPGGVMWTQKNENQYRATVSTAGAAQLALRLFESTGDSQYLQFAREQFGWVEKTLSNENGLFIDGIEGNGNKNQSAFSYNQGLMLGNAVLLYKLTGESAFLSKAEAIADAALSLFTQEELRKQPPIFNAIFFKNLLLLDSVVHDPRYRATVETYADWIQLRTNPSNGLLVVKAGGESKQSLNQAAAVLIFSMLS